MSDNAPLVQRMPPSIVNVNGRFKTYKSELFRVVGSHATVQIVISILLHMLCH